MFQLQRRDLLRSARRGGPSSSHLNANLPDASSAVDHRGGRVYLPPNLTEVLANLRQERYVQQSDGYFERIVSSEDCAGSVLLPPPGGCLVAVRKHLQKGESERLATHPIPTMAGGRHGGNADAASIGAATTEPWYHEAPVHLVLGLTAPEAAQSSRTTMEDNAGRNFCGQLMDIDDSYGIKSSFQIVPEKRCTKCRRPSARLFATEDLKSTSTTSTTTAGCFTAGCGSLERVEQINEYGRRFQSQGFRSAVMYRQLAWAAALRFSYDMSVPNVAHLEPQRGGCCTVMPYFVGDLLELPLTTIQDYSLFPDSR